MTLRFSGLALSAVLLTACASQPDNADSEPTHGPAELQGFTETVDIDVVWRRTIGGGPALRNIRLHPVESEGVVYAADYQGSLSALELDSGDELWSIDLPELITGGVVVKDGSLFLTTEDGMVHRLNKTDGEIIWSQPLSSESIAPVAVDREQVYVRTIDGHLTAYNLADGAQNWTYEAALPTLTVHGTGAPIIVNELVVTGFANGKMVALDRELGIPRWNKRLAVPEGRSELERLVDIDGTPVFDGTVVFASSYHGKAAAVSAEGQTAWETDASTYYGPALGLGNVYLVSDDDRVLAYDQYTGTSVWAQSGLEGRYLNHPVSHSGYIIVADAEGYLHALSQVDGVFSGRIALRPKPLHITQPNQSQLSDWRLIRGRDFGIRSRMQSTGEGLLVYTNAGELMLLQFTRIED